MRMSLEEIFLQVTTDETAAVEAVKADGAGAGESTEEAARD
jgi:hypothetical protein